MKNTIISNRIALCAALLLGAAAGGCADDGAVDSDMHEQGAETDGQPQAQIGSRIKTVKDPKGLYIADVTATGKGCPAGTWDVSVAPDGKVFTMTFSDYIVKLTPTVPGMSLNCDLELSLKSPAGLSYAVTSFGYQGYVYLERGARATLTSNYHFSGLASGAGDRVKSVTGPLDESFLIVDKLPTLDWSPCGTNRKLNISTVLSVTNGPVPRNAEVNVSSIDAASNTKRSIILTLDNKRC